MTAKPQTSTTMDERIFRYGDILVDIMMISDPAYLSQPFVYSKLSYDPKDLIPMVRVSNTILAVAVKADAPYKNVKEFTEAARANPGKFNSGLVQGITEFIFWGYAHQEKLQIAQVPYRDINVAPVEVEETLLRHPAVKLAFVTGVPDARRDEVIGAVIVRHDGKGVDEAALTEHCRRELASYKVPRLIAFVSETELPLTTTGKLQKNRLAELGELLAAGLMRLHARKSSRVSADRGDSSVDFTPDRSGHAAAPTRRTA